MVYVSGTTYMIKIRLLLIEDNRLLRDGILEILRPNKDITVISASGNGRNTMEKIRKLKPNVILLDLGLRSQNSLHIVEIVKRDFPEAKIIIMDLAPVQADILLYVKAGASGFILKDASLDDLLVTIRSVAEGSTVLPALLVDSLFSQIVDQAVRKGTSGLKDAVRMTKREREVIELLAEGLSNRQIGQRLRISTYTIKSHIHNIMEKLALHSRLEVANYSYTEETLKAVAGSIHIITG